MGYDLGRRLSELKKQTDENLAERWRIGRMAFLCFLILVFSRYTILSTHKLPSLNTNTNSQDNAARDDLWIEDTQSLVKERISWLASSPLALIPGTTKTYEKIARTLDEKFDLAKGAPLPEEEDFFFSVSDIPVWWNRMIVGATLRISFVILVSWPLWIIGLIAGYLLMKHNNRKKPNTTLLGVCDRGNGPFYSGIYGPYRPNNSISGTELSCPGLACPKMETKEKSDNHQIISTLKNYGAYNETNSELSRVILAHADFPHQVDEENPLQPEESEEALDTENRVSKTGFVSNEKGMLIDGALRGLENLLKAQSIVKNYINTLKRNGLTLQELEKNYGTHLNSLVKASQSSDQETKELIFSLTASKLWSISELSQQAIATAYLSIEAGKSLVFKRTGNGFTVTSLYPHLQARAVVQSLVPYHQEYDGDTRLIIRQAIISSRRHGDFGRSFLPIKMPIQSRALRDWLEIMYAEKEKKAEVSHLVELDGHIEEIHINFRNGFLSRIRQNFKDDPNQKQHYLWMGLVYKSVLLMPLEELVDISLRGIHQTRLDRIFHLLNLTSKFQARISTSARLPGFKRQAMEADKNSDDIDLISEKIKKLKNGKKIHENWRIVRRMLTRYNWLSTRIGDNSVPLVGVIHGILKQETENSPKHLYVDALVPLRERRFNEILGRNWEHNYYRYAPYKDGITTFTDTEEYEKFIKEQKAEPAPSEIISNEKLSMSA